MLERTALVAYRRSVTTPDVAEAVRLLEVRAAEEGGVRLAMSARPPSLNWNTAGGEPGPTGCPPPASMWVAGREVHLRLSFIERPFATRWEEVTTLWGLAVPLGFTPWLRYPMPGPADEVFHFIGPWQGLYDHLCGEGRGELAWPSVCCAAQVDVGCWEGDKPVERFLQAQLHRLGLHCGPVDGQIGPRTLDALRMFGLQSMSLEEAARHLVDYESPEPSREQRQVGHIIIPGHRFAVNAFGQIATTRVRNGVALAIDGPGRVILDIQDEFEESERSRG